MSLQNQGMLGYDSKYDNPKIDKKIKIRQIKENNKIANEGIGDGLQMEYEESVAYLKKKYKEAKQARKDSEKRKIELEHRISVLKNQEKYAIAQFQNTKKKIEQILENRNKYEERMKKNDLRVRGGNQRKNNSFNNGNNYKGMYYDNSGNNYMENNPNSGNLMNINSDEVEKVKEQIIEEINYEEGEKKKIEGELENINNNINEMTQNFLLLFN